MFFALFLLHDGCVLHVNTFTTVQNFKGYLFQKNCFNGFVKSYSVNCEWKWGRCHENYDDLENSDLRICEIPECFLRTPQDVDVMVVFHVEPDCWKKIRSDRDSSIFSFITNETLSSQTLSSLKRRRHLKRWRFKWKFTECSIIPMDFIKLLDFFQSGTFKTM